MKWILVIALLTLVPFFLGASPLTDAARRARSLRGKSARSFTDADLETHHGPDRVEVVGPRPPTALYRAPDRDRVREREYWRREKEKLDEELARIDSSVRRLESRLKEAEARQRSRWKRQDDPTLDILRDSVRSLRSERAQRIDRVLERARKAGALPGWLR